MTTATYEQVLREAQQLTPEEQDELIEELADIRAYDTAKAAIAAGVDEVIPLDQAIAEIEAEWTSKGEAG